MTACAARVSAAARTSSRWSLVLVGLTVLVVAPARAAESIYITQVPTRTNVTVPTLVIDRSAQNPRASVILFTGGDGKVDLNDTSQWPSNQLKTAKTDCNSTTDCPNFLLRVRNQLATHNFNVAVMDVPSDQEPYGYFDSSGAPTGFRESAEHVLDIAYVIYYMQQLSPVPVWLVGTSRGTASAVIGTLFTSFYTINATIVTPAGVVLTSSIVQSGDPDDVLAQLLGNIHVPALMVGHVDDSCPVSPPVGVSEIAGLLAGSPDFRGLRVSGGTPVDASDMCDASGYHGFSGSETAVVTAIARWIKNH